MSTANLLPRSSRQSFYDALPGQAVFGPTQWIAFDVRDVDVRVRSSDAEPWQAPAVAWSASLSAARAGFVTIAFADDRPTGSKVLVQGRRIHERITDVTRAGALVTAALEREFDLQAVVLQEVSRDAHAALGAVDRVLEDTHQAVEATAASAALAEAYATAPYGVPVGGTKRSALHWSTVSQQHASDAQAWAASVGGLIYDFGLLSEATTSEEDWGTL